MEKNGGLETVHTPITEWYIIPDIDTVDIELECNYRVEDNTSKLRVETLRARKLYWQKFGIKYLG